MPLDVVLNGADWLGVIFEIVGTKTSDATQTVRILRMLRMIRLLRMTRLPMLLDKMAETAGIEDWFLTLDIVRIIVFFLGVVHLIACFWYAIGRVEPNGDLNWIAKQDLPDADLGYRYVTSLHWSITQFIGSMEVRPYNSLERTYACIVLTFAFIVSASFVSSITSAMTRHSIQKTRQNSQMTTLQRYLRQNHISHRLVLRIQRNAHHAMVEKQKNMPESEVELIKMISEPLRIEMHCELYAPSLHSYPLFSHWQKHCLGLIRVVCTKAISEKSLSAGDVLFSQGESPGDPEMLFVSAGSLRYTRTVRLAIEFPSSTNVQLVASDKSEKQSEDDLHCGEYLCEAVLWVACWTHQGTARALSESRLMALNSEIFQEVVCQFGDDDPAVFSFAQNFVDSVNDPDMKYSDLGDREFTKRLVRETHFDGMFNRQDSLTSLVSHHVTAPEIFHRLVDALMPSRGSSPGRKRMSDPGQKIIALHHNKRVSSRSASTSTLGSTSVSEVNEQAR